MFLIRARVKYNLLRFQLQHLFSDVRKEGLEGGGEKRTEEV